MAHSSQVMNTINSSSRKDLGILRKVCRRDAGGDGAGGGISPTIDVDAAVSRLAMAAAADTFGSQNTITCFG